MTAALALGQARGLSAWLLSETLPEIEHAMIKSIRKPEGADSD